MKLKSAAGATVLLLLPAHLPDPRPVRYRPVEASSARAESLPPPLNVVTGVVARNTTFAALLQDALSPAEVHDLVQAVRPVYDLARIAAGRPYGLSLTPEGALAALTYGVDELRTLKVTRTPDGFDARIDARSYDVRTVAVAGTITSSLFGAVQDAGEEDQLAIDLAEIFAWDVDFNTELQPGDSFRVAVEKKYLDGRFAQYGRILAAELARGERLHRALHFDEGSARGYYKPDGTPLRKAFLRSPLKFSRISSGFSRGRFHPILKTVRPHLGVDYAARTGTPVMSAGDGVVLHAGWQGGYGKTVRLRHANGYETLYGHLSRIHVRPGQRVSQGALIGAVGSTGLSTGPHLDYRMIRNGAFVNPLRILSPPAEPIAPAQRETFERIGAERLALLESTAGAAAQTASAP